MVSDTALTVELEAPRRRRVFHALTTRAVLVTCAVALVSAIATAAVAYPITTRASQQQARKALADQADIVAAAVIPRNAARRKALTQRLRKRGIELVVIQDGVADQRWLPVMVVKRVASGVRVTHTVKREGVPMMVEGRITGKRDGIVLAQPVDTAVRDEILTRLALALLAGLGGGVVAGVLLARWLARPLRRAAAAARRLSGGDRTVRLPIMPPTESADLARALNDLTSALAASESRQRDFLMSVSHELRTPLTTIRGYAEAFADDMINADAAARAGRTVLAEADRLDRLVADLLALARLEAQEFRLEVAPADLTHLVRSAAEAWSPRCADAGVSLRTELPPGPVPVHTDPERLRQVIDGMTENALRVVPVGAPVVLAARVEPTAHPGGMVPGPRYVAVVEVRDGGPGLSDQDLAVAFDRGALFHRYRGVRRVGTGLGLALAARLVQRLGGTITAGHSPEGGAKFTVRLPLP